MRRSLAATGVLLLAVGVGVVGGQRDALHRQAHEAMARYADAVQAATQGFVPAGPLTDQLGEWEAEIGENGKRALLAGQLEAAATLPSTPGDRHPVTWPDGTTLDLPLMSAQQALDQLTSTAESKDCSGCPPLRVTGAELVGMPLETDRGTAQVPVWVFKPCGADYSAEPVESDTAVVVIVHDHPSSGSGFCDMIGAARPAEATLRRPLGDRAVLEVVQGLPVP